MLTHTQLTVENAEFQDNGKGSTPDKYYYQILADYGSNVQLKEVQVYEGQHSGGFGELGVHREVGRRKYSWAWERGH
jgi:hypothetical protein